MLATQTLMALPYVMIALSLMGIAMLFIAERTA